MWKIFKKNDKSFASIEISLNEILEDYDTPGLIAEQVAKQVIDQFAEQIISEIDLKKIARNVELEAARKLFR